MAAQYPDVTVDYMFVDNAAMQIILNPKQFDVILTENMFGDIISDEASVMSGSLGILPSASIGEAVQHCLSLFMVLIRRLPEKILQIHWVPFLSAAMMLDYFELNEEAQSGKRCG